LKIKILGSFWGGTMNQEFGITNKLKIEQMYIQLNRNSDSTVYSYPAVIKDLSNLKENLKKQPPVVSDIYYSCKDKAALSYSNFDIANFTQLRATVCYPI
jgi:hypothetical protein